MDRLNATREGRVGPLRSYLEYGEGPAWSSSAKKKKKNRQVSQGEKKKGELP